MQIGFFQYAPRFAEVAANLDAACAALSNAEGELFVLPELAFTGYHFSSREELARLSETTDNSKTVTRLTRLCQKKKFHLVVGMAERDGKQIYNSALLIGPEGLISTYRKIHLFNEEKHYFDAGNLMLSVVSVGKARLGLMVCFDWVFPEVARSLALLGAEVLCHPSNLVLDHCQKAMRVRCLENGVFAVTANRTGTDARPHGTLTFTGKSQIVAPNGTVLTSASSDEQGVFVSEIVLKKAHKKAITPNNHLLNDRRPEFYQLS